MEKLAHSAAYCGREQTYENHTEGVTKLIKDMLKDIQPYVPKVLYTRLERVLLAGEFHDVGKLDKEDQQVLRENKRKTALPIPHQIAGANIYMRSIEIYMRRHWYLDIIRLDFRI
nr:HD domain-containing protein [uncultured Blautia sp.]